MWVRLGASRQTITHMKKKSLPSYIKAERLKWSLSQKQIAVLLGSKGTSHISRHELYQTLPKLETAIAYEIIFGLPLKTLFRGKYEAIEEKVMTHAYRLYLTVENRRDEAGKKKAKLFKEMLGRATSKDQNNNI